MPLDNHAGSGLTLASRAAPQGFKRSPQLPRSERLESQVQTQLGAPTAVGERGILIRNNARNFMMVAQRQLRSTGTEPDLEEIQELAQRLATEAQNTSGRR